MFKREISASGWKAMTFSNANVNGPTNVQSTPRSMVPEPGGLSCRRTVRICSCTPPGRLFRLTGALAGENPAGPNPGQSFFDRCTECFSLNLPAVSSEACRKFAVSCRRLNVGRCTRLACSCYVVVVVVIGDQLNMNVTMRQTIARRTRRISVYNCRVRRCGGHGRPMVRSCRLWKRWMTQTLIRARSEIRLPLNLPGSFFRTWCIFCAYQNRSSIAGPHPFPELWTSDTIASFRDAVQSTEDL
ncbi:hypothetical protein MPTK2_7g10740 [Marchantia polymorpha subsp. ruderalis]